MLCPGRARSLHPQLYYTLDRPPSKWTYGTGFISAEMVRPKALKPRVR